MLHHTDWNSGVGQLAIFQYADSRRLVKRSSPLRLWKLWAPLILTLLLLLPDGLSGNVEDQISPSLGANKFDLFLQYFGQINWQADPERREVTKAIPKFPLSGAIVRT